MAEYASIPARTDQWSLMEAEHNARWSQLAYLDGPGYTLWDRMEAKLDLQRNYFSRSSSHGVMNSTKEISTQPFEPHFTSSMAEPFRAEISQKIMQSYTRILDLLQKEIDASEAHPITDAFSTSMEQVPSMEGTHTEVKPDEYSGPKDPQPWSTTVLVNASSATTKSEETKISMDVVFQRRKGKEIFAIISNRISLRKSPDSRLLRDTSSTVPTPWSFHISFALPPPKPPDRVSDLISPLMYDGCSDVPVKIITDDIPPPEPPECVFVSSSLPVLLLMGNFLPFSEHSRSSMCIRDKLALLRTHIFTLSDINWGAAINNLLFPACAKTVQHVSVLISGTSRKPRSIFSESQYSRNQLYSPSVDFKACSPPQDQKFYFSLQSIPFNERSSGTNQLQTTINGPAVHLFVFDQCPTSDTTFTHMLLRQIGYYVNFDLLVGLNVEKAEHITMGISYVSSISHYALAHIIVCHFMVMAIIVRHVWIGFRTCPTGGGVVIRGFVNPMAKCFKNHNTTTALIFFEGNSEISKLKDPLEVMVLFQNVKNLLVSDSIVMATKSSSLNLQYRSIDWFVGAILNIVSVTASGYYPIPVILDPMLAEIFSQHDTRPLNSYRREFVSRIEGFDMFNGYWIMDNTWCWSLNGQYMVCWLADFEQQLILHRLPILETQPRTLTNVEVTIGDIRAKLIKWVSQEHVWNFSVRLGIGQGWDPGGQLDMSTTTRTYQFKLWDPGKYVPAIMSSNLEDNVVFKGGGNVMSQLEAAPLVGAKPQEDAKSAHELVTEERTKEYITDCELEKWRMCIV